MSTTETPSRAAGEPGGPSILTAAPGDLRLLARFRDASAATFPDLSPVTGAVLATVPAAGPSDARAAVADAAAAFPGWARTPIGDRRAILLRAADLLEQDLEEHQALMAYEVGAVRGWSEVNLREAASTLREAAGLVSSPVGELLPSHRPGTRIDSLREPAGVVLAVVPWNAPIVLAARATAVALALGNTVVIRPSEHAPFSAGVVLADALERAGLPRDVVRVVTSGPAESPAVIAALIEHPAVQRVVFIGSTAVGRRIGELAGRALTPAVLELGGKNATIVRADVDVSAAAGSVALGAFANSGQVCMSTDRVLVHRAVAERFTDALTQAARQMVTGDPREPGTHLGPLIDERSADRFAALVHDALAAGARLLAGSAAVDGRYARATVLTQPGPTARIATEEAFSPVVAVEPVEDDEDALAAVKRGPYGLIASILSADRAAAEDLAARLPTGAVHINGPSIGDEPHVPFGGLGASGVGRLGGVESVRFFTRQRTVYRHA